MAIAQLMVVLDSTVVNIALPSAQRALDFPNSDRQWVVTAYALAFGPAEVPPAPFLCFTLAIAGGFPARIHMVPGVALHHTHIIPTL